MTNQNQTLLDVRNLSLRFVTENGNVDAVKNVSFSLGRGETLAIVGESGSGKSVTALSFTRLLPEPPAQYTSGEILWKGENVLAMGPRQLRKNPRRPNRLYFSGTFDFVESRLYDS